MPVLSPQQVQALEALEWLYDARDGSRRSGRTTAQAFAYLRHACRNLGTWVSVIDVTHPTQSVNQVLLNAIENLAHLAGLDIQTRRSPSIRVTEVTSTAVAYLFDHIEEGAVASLRQTTPQQRVIALPPPPPAPPPPSAWDRLSAEDAV